MSKAGEKILKSLREAVDSLQPGAKPLTRRTYVLPDEPGTFDGPAIRAIREGFHMSQGVFARFLCVSPGTVQSWEQGRREPSPLARRFLGELVAGGEHFRRRFAELAEIKPGRSDAGNAMRRPGA